MEKKELELLASIARLNAIVAGMISENKIRERKGQSLAYDEEAFRKEIEENGVVFDPFAEVFRHSAGKD